MSKPAPSSKDQKLGKFGNTTIYQRPDGSRYGVDRLGRVAEVPKGQKFHR